MQCIDIASAKLAVLIVRLSIGCLYAFFHEDHVRPWQLLFWFCPSHVNTTIVATRAQQAGAICSSVCDLWQVSYAMQLLSGLHLPEHLAHHLVQPQ
jgi:hypothetical protein